MAKSQDLLDKRDRNRKADEDRRAVLLGKIPANPQSGVLNIGTVVYGDNLPAHLGVTTNRNQFCIKADEFLTQTIVIGKTKSGKTELQKTVVHQTLINTDWDVVIIDGKGDIDFARWSGVMAHKLGIAPIPIVRLGWGSGYKSAVFNGFAGDNEAVYNRLVVMLSLQPLESEGDFYRTQKRDMLQHICGHNTHMLYKNVPRFEPPRSFAELQERATVEWLQKKFANTTLIEKFEKNGKVTTALNKSWRDTVPNLQADIRTASTPFLHLIHSNGFSFGDYRLTHFSIAAGAILFDADYFFRFLAGCIQHHLSVQAHTGRKTLFILDEVAGFGADNIARLINTARTQGGAFFLSMQSKATLGRDENLAEQTVDGTNLRFLMRCDATEDFLKRFGTRKVLDMTQTMQDGEAEKELIRYKDVPKITTDMLNPLYDGRMVFALAGNIVTVKTRMTTDFNPKEFDETTMEVRNTPEENKVVPETGTTESKPEKPQRKIVDKLPD